MKQPKEFVPAGHFYSPLPDLGEVAARRDVLFNRNVDHCPGVDLRQDLFVDSSHVVKTGSDVGHILFQILPLLERGVLVHFHDILWPFEYPEGWVLEGRAWNEAYCLRAFLQFNTYFEILYFNSYVGWQHSAILQEKMPLCQKNPGGSLWLRKIQ